ncbi:hypothetical protein P5673_025079, partial [Acropora cervicornis]
TVKPIIVDSADEEPFENEEVYDEDYSPSIPLEEDEDETDEKPQQSSTDEKEHVKTHGKRKFIVFEKHLLSLFALCPICGGPAEARITKVIGTMVKINQWCTDEKSCQFSRMWFSQPFVKEQIPCGNLLLSASILISVNSRVVNLCSKVQLKAHTVIYPNAFDCFPGCSTAKTLQMLKLMNLATISERSFHRHTSSYLNAIVIQQWKKHQQGLTSGFLEKNDGLILAGCNDIVFILSVVSSSYKRHYTGDGRCDSLGCSAKLGSFTLIEQRINRVVDFQVNITIAAVKITLLWESNEVRNSAWMEHEELVRAVQVHTNSGLSIAELITDRLQQNTIWIKINLHNTTHYFDIWHFFKELWVNLLNFPISLSYTGLCKKIDKLAKKKDREEVSPVNFQSHILVCSINT